MLKIRLQRIGKKKDPAFRIVVAEHTCAVKWRFLEKIWSFVSRRKDSTLNIDIDRAKFWIWRWAQPSQTMARMLLWKWLKEAEIFVEKRVTKPKKEKIVESKENKSEDKQ